MTGSLTTVNIESVRRMRVSERTAAIIVTVSTVISAVVVAAALTAVPTFMADATAVASVAVTTVAVVTALTVAASALTEVPTVPVVAAAAVLLDSLQRFSAAQGGAGLCLLKCLVVTVWIHKSTADIESRTKGVSSSLVLLET